MDKLDETLCRLCLDTTNGECSQIIDGYTKEVLSILLLHKNLDGDKNLVCNDCSEKLSAAFDFKVACLNTEDCIYPYIISDEDSMIDLKEIYLKEKAGEHVNGMSEDEVVCRLCFQLLTSNFISLEQVDPDMIEKYIPEVNFCSTINPVMCEGCFKSLVRHSLFLKACLDTEERIKCIDVGARVNVKTEEIEIKPEQQVENGNSDEETDKSNQTIFKMEQSREDQIPQFETNQLLFTYDELAVKVYKCDQCSFGCMYKCDLISHQVIHNGPPLQAFKCDKCPYETKRKKHLKRHEMIHKDRSELSMYNCDKCPYASPYKSVISKHQLRHKDVSEVETFRCDECEYVTIFKSYLRTHKVRHKSMSELKLFKCEDCEYETKRKKCFVRHKLTHKDSAEVQMHKCDSCGFETRHKNSFATHQLKHMQRKEMQLFKCDNCEYETYRKVYLIRHQLTHKKPSQVQMYKCDVCDFQTKHKCSLQRHQARH